MIYQRQMEDAMSMSSDTKSRRKRFARAPIDQEPILTNRDLSILNAILSHGGVLTTLQVAMLFCYALCPELSLSEIGRAFHRCHPSVSNGVRRVARQLAQTPCQAAPPKERSAL